MNTLIRKFRVQHENSGIGVLLLITFILFLASCGGGSGNKVREEQLKEVKESSVENLNDMMQDIDERIEYLNEQAEEADDDLKAEIEESIEVLEDQKELLEKELEKVEDATFETWNDVLDNTSETIREVRSNINDISLKINELIEE
ncbi:MAG: hypothetical protein R6U58_09915 [Bacteroidales bacterium]